MDPKNVTPGSIEENDLELPGLKPDIKPEVVEPIVEIKPETEVKPEVKPVIPVDKPGELPEGVQKDEELPDFLKPKPAEQKPEETIEEEKPEIKSEDKDASVFEIDEPGEPGTKKEDEKITIDYTGLATELGLELEENSKEKLKEVVLKKIEDAKTRVEPDLSKFNDEQKLIFKWLEDPESSLKDFFEPLKVFDDFLAEPDDVKVLAYLQHEEGLDEEAAQTRLQEIIDGDAFDEYVNKIDESTYALRDKRFNALMGTISKSQEAKQLKIQQEAEKEKQAMAKVVDETNEFLGIPIPQNAKDAIKKKIEDGRLTKENDNATAQILGHYFMLWGARALQRLNERIKEASDGGYGRGIDKGTSILHNSPPETDKPGSHKEAKAEVVKPGTLPNMNKIDSDSVSGFQSS